MKMPFVVAVILVLSLAACAAAEQVIYEGGGNTCEGYFVTPAEDAPLVLLIHDWDGLTDYEVERAEMLVELGYAVFAADLFGAGVRPETVEKRRELTGALYADREEMRLRLYAALDAAAEQGANTDNAVAVGYCFGGTCVLELARSGADLNGFVTFHGGLATPEGQDYAEARGQYLVLHGTADQAVTMEEFAGLAVELEEADVSHEMITYGGAPHAFSVFGSDRYREEADRKSWKRFTAFLEDVLH
ncbi:MAG: prolyl oligopeptidase family serine peptidase [Candidatus Eisenbacteria bacterium]|nr:prolyl oligopeptidase family serine peptidase [Candidatus Eisenbacteria bacterium]